MNRNLTRGMLHEENLAYAGSGGVSERNRCWGFIPGFCDTETGIVQISRFSNGLPAPIHLLEGLPPEWIKERDTSGRVIAVKESVIAGFLYQNRFFTREQAAKVISQ